MDRDELQGLCALHTCLAKMDGHKFDKAAMRYSAMGDYCLHVMACGRQRQLNSINSIVWEAVSTAIVGDPMNVPGQPFDRKPWLWMEEKSNEPVL